MNFIKPKLKIGLLMKSFDIPSWMYLTIEKIQKSNFAEITLIILNKPNDEKFSFAGSPYLVYVCKLLRTRKLIADIGTRGAH